MWKPRPADGPENLRSLKFPKDRSEASRVVAHESGGAGDEEGPGLLWIVDDPKVGADSEDPAAMEKAAAVEPDRPGLNGDLRRVTADHPSSQR